MIWVIDREIEVHVKNCENKIGISVKLALVLFFCIGDRAIRKILGFEFF